MFEYYLPEETADSVIHVNDDLFGARDGFEGSSNEIGACWCQHLSHVYQFLSFKLVAPSVCLAEGPPVPTRDNHTLGATRRRGRVHLRSGPLQS